MSLLLFRVYRLGRHVGGELAARKVRRLEAEVARLKDQAAHSYWVGYSDGGSDVSAAWRAAEVAR